MLAEVVLRPPDVRHLDAAFQGAGRLAARANRASRSRSATCSRRAARRAAGRSSPTRSSGRSTTRRASPAGRDRSARHYRCTVCRDQRGGGEQRQAPLDADDLAPGHRRRRRRARCARPLRDRFPEIPGAESLADELLDLHTPRQLVGLGAILERIESDLRAAPVLAALRLAFAPRDPAGQPARQRAGPGRARCASRRATSGRRPAPSGASATRGSPSRTPSGSSAGSSSGSRAGRPGRSRPASARTCGASARGPRPPVVGLSGPRGLRRPRATIPTRYGRTGADAADPPRPRPAADAPEPGAPRGRLPRDGLGARSRGGGAAADRGPRRCLAPAAVELAGDGARARRSRRVEPVMARDGRVVQLVDGGAEATRRGRRSAARRRLPAARAPGWPTPTTTAGGRRRAAAARADGCHRAPRTRGNVGLEPVPGGAGDPDVVPGARPVRAARAGRRTAVLGRGCRPDRDRDRRRDAPGAWRAGALRAAAGRDPGRARPGRRAAAADAPRCEPRPSDGGRGARSLPPTPTSDDRPGRAADARRGDRDPVGRRRRRRTPRPASAAPRVDRDGPADPVERLLGLIRDELGRPTQRRLTEIEPGRWWLADPDDIAAAAVPLADRVEWAVFSLLSTAGPIVGDRLLRADRRAVHRPRPARRGARPGLPRELSEPRQHARPARHRRRPAPPQPGAHRAARGASPNAGHRLGHAGLDRPPRADPAASARGLLGDLLEPGERRPRSAVHQPGDRRPRRGRRHLVRPRQARVPVRGRMDGDARRAAPPPPRPDPARRGARPVPGHRAGADRARPLQARALAAAAGGPRGRELAHHQVEPPARRSWPATRSTWTTWSRTSGSIRPSSGAPSRCPCSAS